jgi:hypothetical protein
MILKIFYFGFFILINISLFAESVSSPRKKVTQLPSGDSIQISINSIKRYISGNNVWEPENPEIIRAVNGLIHYAEDEHIDSILVKLDKFQNQDNFRYINRLPEKVSDSLKVHGFVRHKTILEKMKQLDRAIWSGVDLNSIPLTEELKKLERTYKQPIPPGDEKTILEKTGIILPDSLKNVMANPDSLRNAPNNFERIKNRQQIRKNILEEARLKYNRNVPKLNADSIIFEYRKFAVRVFSDSLKQQLHDSLKLQNSQAINHYNDSIVRLVNDSINHFVRTLERHAQNDSVSVWITSLSGNSTQLWLRNNQRTMKRFYIKNEQNDSLAIRMMNIDKHSIGIAIDDDVTFNRIVQQQRLDFALTAEKPEIKLTRIQKKFEVVSPWDLGGNGTFGFTQTYLNNWKAGGKSSFSFLMVMKGYANYSYNKKIRWENSGEIRNGWIRQGGDLNQTQKNDDKLELISRLGISAFKKWYYSTEIDFITQFFNGYDYPDKTKIMSSYLSPVKTMFKLGMDYKPNKNFSLFISPITAKNVYVRDTARIDQTKFGVSANSQSFWEPGLNTDIRYRINLSPRISFETKYKMFMNYQEPFKKVDINWENTLVSQLTDRINMSVMLYMLYDDNVTFPTGVFDDDGKEIYKAKWQTRELITIGFSYKINKHIYKRKKLN